MILAAQNMWTGAGNAGDSDDPVSLWLRPVFIAIMAIFIMVSLILGSMAFKQLAAEGNWKDFWSKIAGALGMFVVPILIYWLVDR